MNPSPIKPFFLLLTAGILFVSCDESINPDDLIGNSSTSQTSFTSSSPLVANIDHQVLSEWTSLLLELDRYSYGARPTATARALAYIYLAAYETAVPGMPGYESNDDRLRGFRIQQEVSPEGIDWQIALNASLADVMDHFMLNVADNRSSQIAILERQINSSLSDGVESDVVEASESWGRYIADQVIEYSETDRDAEEQILDPQPLSYEPPTGDGFWTYSADPERALFPYWGEVRTFVISSRETSSIDPLAYSEDPSSDYYAEMLEVYETNNQARDDDGEDLWIAEFWSDDVEELMMSPPVRQISIAQQLIEQNDLHLEAALELMLKLGFSLNDAAVSAWADKYEHMVMRPNVFIHEFIDPNFQTNLYRLVYWPNPSFPGYPSGHSAFASAAAGIFIDAFGDQINFTDRTHEGRDEFRGAPRTFSSFTEMAEENGYSRIPLGVHIRMDCTEGLRLGYEVADAVNNLSLTRPL